MQNQPTNSTPQQKAYPPALPFQIPPKLLPDSSWDQLITITEVRLKSSTLFALEPVTLKSLKNTDSGYIFVLNQDLGINVSAKSYKQLVLDVHDYIDFLWSKYACADDSLLTAAAQQIKRHLLQTFIERQLVA
jgi:hypothetical protein